MVNEKLIDGAALLAWVENEAEPQWHGEELWQEFVAAEIRRRMAEKPAPPGDEKLRRLREWFVKGVAEGEWVQDADTRCQDAIDQIDELLAEETPDTPAAPTNDLLTDPPISRSAAEAQGDDVEAWRKQALSAWDPETEVYVRVHKSEITQAVRMLRERDERIAELEELRRDDIAELQDARLEAAGLREELKTLKNERSMLQRDVARLEGLNQNPIHPNDLLAIRRRSTERDRAVARAEAAEQRCRELREAAVDAAAMLRLLQRTGPLRHGESIKDLGDLIARLDGDAEKSTDARKGDRNA